MIGYLDWLNEQAIAREGNWKFDDAHIGELSYFMYSKHWLQKGELNIEGTDFEIIKHDNSNTWRVGKIIQKENSEDKIFESVLFLEMENSKNIGYKINISPLYRAKMVGVSSSARGQV
jgi:hypothetical protein